MPLVNPRAFAFPEPGDRGNAPCKLNLSLGRLNANTTQPRIFQFALKFYF